jgi:hypothetical protein
MKASQCICGEMSAICKSNEAITFKCPEHYAVTIDKRTPTVQWAWPYYPYQSYVVPHSGQQTTA